MNNDVEKIMMEDGRMAERRITVDEHGDKHIELWVEEPRNLKLERRIVEKHANIVSERKIELVDDTGEIYDVKVESVDPNKNMQLVDHIGVVDKQNVSKYATKDELKDAVVAAVVEAQSMEAQNVNVEAQSIAPFPPQPFMNAQSVVANNVENKKSVTLIDWILIGAVIAAGVALAFQWLS